MVLRSLGDTRLQSYASGFYGYGCYDAPIWIVGRQAEVATDPQEIVRRVAAWHKRGERELEDLWEFHQVIAIDGSHGPETRIRASWGRYTRLLLHARGIPCPRPAFAACACPSSYQVM